jgi:hypothetical protein
MSVVSFVPDYGKWEFRWSQENFQIALEHFKEVFMQHPEANNGKRDMWKVSVLRDRNAGGNYYILECWGRACIQMHFLSGPHWFANLMRVDFKAQVYDLDGDQNYYIGMALGMHDTGYSLAVHNKPIRMKVGDKDAGGRGFSIGSHHSDLRISSYNKGFGPVGLEFQLKNDMLVRLKAQSIANFARGASNVTLLRELSQACQAVAYGRLRQVFTRAGMLPELEKFLPEEPGSSVVFDPGTPPTPFRDGAEESQERTQEQLEI